MSYTKLLPENVLEKACVDRLEYSIDDQTGNVSVKGAHGIGRHLVRELAKAGYVIVARQRT